MSSLLPTRFHVSRGTLDHNSIILAFIYRTITFYGGTFQFSSISHYFSLCYVLNPGNKFPVWALSLSLAATKKIDFSFSSSRYLDVSVPWVTFIKLCIHLMIHGVSHVSFLIRRSSDLRLCAPTRSLSQLITSFIGSWCQGIHHAPFVAWPILVIVLILQRIEIGFANLACCFYKLNYVQFSKNNFER